MSTTSASNPLPLRADARRNRELILEAARDAFADGGMDVGVEEIARRAGVGKATFFRRFPTKEALVVAVFEGFIEEVIAAVDVALLETDCALAPLRAFLRHSMESQAKNKAFFEAVATRFVPPPAMTDRVMEAIERVMAPAIEAGVLREGIEPGDVSTATKIRPMDGLLLPEAAWDRYLDVIIRGLAKAEGARDEPMHGIAADPCTMVREFSAKSA
jgi:AcrR family transcriptional regulator